jgi:hypothetical protein
MGTDRSVLAERGREKGISPAAPFIPTVYRVAWYEHTGPVLS